LSWICLKATAKVCTVQVEWLDLVPCQRCQKVVVVVMGSMQKVMLSSATEPTSECA
jgi:hypothetical protein